MLESWLAPLLSRLLSEYVKRECFDARDLEVNIYRGFVRLSNLELRPDALDRFQLPFALQRGFVGQVTIQMPWGANNGPAVVSIDRVYLSLECVWTHTGASADRRAAFARAQKMEALARAEARVRASAGSAGHAPHTLEDADAQSQRGFWDKLMASLINNIQLYVRGVHVRVMDRFVSSSPGVPRTCVLGLVCEYAHMRTCSEDWSTPPAHEDAAEAGVGHTLYNYAAAVYSHIQGGKRATTHVPKAARNVFKVINVKNVCVYFRVCDDAVAREAGDMMESFHVGRSASAPDTDAAAAAPSTLLCARDVAAAVKEACVGAHGREGSAAPPPHMQARESMLHIRGRVRNGFIVPSHATPHDFILLPVDAEIRLKLCNGRSHTQPRVETSVNVSRVCINVNSALYAQLCAWACAYAAAQTRARHAALRPAQRLMPGARAVSAATENRGRTSSTQQDHVRSRIARAWWRYAVCATQSEIGRARLHARWRDVEQRATLRRAYIWLYKRACACGAASQSGVEWDAERVRVWTSALHPDEDSHVQLHAVHAHPHTRSRTRARGRHRQRDRMAPVTRRDDGSSPTVSRSGDGSDADASEASDTSHARRRGGMQELARAVRAAHALVAGTLTHTVKRLLHKSVFVQPWRAWARTYSRWMSMYAQPRKHDDGYDTLVDLLHAPVPNVVETFTPLHALETELMQRLENELSVWDIFFYRMIAHTQLDVALRSARATTDAHPASSRPDSAAPRVPRLGRNEGYARVAIAPAMRRPTRRTVPPRTRTPSTFAPSPSDDQARNSEDDADMSSHVHSHTRSHARVRKDVGPTAVLPYHMHSHSLVQPVPRRPQQMSDDDSSTGAVRADVSAPSAVPAPAQPLLSTGAASTVRRKRTRPRGPAGASEASNAPSVHDGSSHARDRDVPASPYMRAISRAAPPPLAHSSSEEASSHARSRVSDGFSRSSSDTGEPAHGDGSAGPAVGGQTSLRYWLSFEWLWSGAQPPASAAPATLPPPQARLDAITDAQRRELFSAIDYDPAHLLEPFPRGYIISSSRVQVCDVCVMLSRAYVDTPGLARGPARSLSRAAAEAPMAGFSPLFFLSLSDVHVCVDARVSSKRMSIRVSDVVGVDVRDGADAHTALVCAARRDKPPSISDARSRDDSQSVTTHTNTHPRIPNVASTRSLKAHTADDEDASTFHDRVTVAPTAVGAAAASALEAPLVFVCVDTLASAATRPAVVHVAGDSSEEDALKARTQTRMDDEDDAESHTHTLGSERATLTSTRASTHTRVTLGAHTRSRRRERKPMHPRVRPPAASAVPAAAAAPTPQQTLVPAWMHAADVYLRLRVRACDLCADGDTLSALSAFFATPTQALETTPGGAHILASAERSIASMRERFTQSLARAYDARAAVGLDVHISRPRVLIPLGTPLSHGTQLPGVYADAVVVLDVGDVRIATVALQSRWNISHAAAAVLAARSDNVSSDAGAHVVASGAVAPFMKGSLMDIGHGRDSSATPLRALQTHVLARMHDADIETAEALNGRDRAFQDASAWPERMYDRYRVRFAAMSMRLCSLDPTHPRAVLSAGAIVNQPALVSLGVFKLKYERCIAGASGLLPHHRIHVVSTDTRVCVSTADMYFMRWAAAHAHSYAVHVRSTWRSWRATLASAAARASASAQQPPARGQPYATASESETGVGRLLQRLRASRRAEASLGVLSPVHKPSASMYMSDFATSGNEMHASTRGLPPRGGAEGAHVNTGQGSSNSMSGTYTMIHWTFGRDALCIKVACEDVRSFGRVSDDVLLAASPALTLRLGSGDVKFVKRGQDAYTRADLSQLEMHAQERADAPVHAAMEVLPHTDTPAVTICSLVQPHDRIVDVVLSRVNVYPPWGILRAMLETTSVPEDSDVVSLPKPIRSASVDMNSCRTILRAQVHVFRLESRDDCDTVLTCFFEDVRASMQSLQYPDPCTRVSGSVGRLRLLHSSHGDMQEVLSLLPDEGVAALQVQTLVARVSSDEADTIVSLDAGVPYVTRLPAQALVAHGSAADGVLFRVVVGSAGCTLEPHVLIRLFSHATFVRSCLLSVDDTSTDRATALAPQTRAVLYWLRVHSVATTLRVHDREVKLHGALHVCNSSNDASKLTHTYSLSDFSLWYVDADGHREPLVAPTHARVLRELHADGNCSIRATLALCEINLTPNALSALRVMMNACADLLALVRGTKPQRDDVAPPPPAKFVLDVESFRARLVTTASEHVLQLLRVLVEMQIDAHTRSSLTHIGEATLMDNGATCLSDCSPIISLSVADATDGSSLVVHAQESSRRTLNVNTGRVSAKAYPTTVHTLLRAMHEFQRAGEHSSGSAPAAEDFRHRDVLSAIAQSPHALSVNVSAMDVSLFSELHYRLQLQTAALSLNHVHSCDTEFPSYALTAQGNDASALFQCGDAAPHQLLWPITMRLHAMTMPATPGLSLSLQVVCSLTRVRMSVAAREFGCIVRALQPFAAASPPSVVGMLSPVASPSAGRQVDARVTLSSPHTHMIALLFARTGSESASCACENPQVAACVEVRVADVRAHVSGAGNGFAYSAHVPAYLALHVRDMGRKTMSKGIDVADPRFHVHARLHRCVDTHINIDMWDGSLERRMRLSTPTVSMHLTPSTAAVFQRLLQVMAVTTNYDAADLHVDARADLGGDDVQGHVIDEFTGPDCVRVLLHRTHVCLWNDSPAATHLRVGHMQLHVLPHACVWLPAADEAQDVWATLGGDDDAGCGSYALLFRDTRAPLLDNAHECVCSDGERVVSAHVSLPGGVGAHAVVSITSGTRARQQAMCGRFLGARGSEVRVKQALANVQAAIADGTCIQGGAFTCVRLQPLLCVLNQTPFLLTSHLADACDTMCAPCARRSAIDGESLLTASMATARRTLPLEGEASAARGVLGRREPRAHISRAACTTAPLMESWPLLPLEASCTRRECLSATVSMTFTAAGATREPSSCLLLPVARWLQHACTCSGCVRRICADAECLSVVAASSGLHAIAPSPSAQVAEPRVILETDSGVGALAHVCVYVHALAFRSFSDERATLCVRVTKYDTGALRVCVSASMLVRVQPGVAVCSLREVDVQPSRHQRDGHWGTVQLAAPRVRTSGRRDGFTHMARVNVLQDEFVAVGAGSFTPTSARVLTRTVSHSVGQYSMGSMHAIVRASATSLVVPLAQLRQQLEDLDARMVRPAHATVHSVVDAQSITAHMHSYAAKVLPSLSAPVLTLMPWLHVRNDTALHMLLRLHRLEEEGSAFACLHVAPYGHIALHPYALLRAEEKGGAGDATRRGRVVSDTHVHVQLSMCSPVRWSKLCTGAASTEQSLLTLQDAVPPAPVPQGQARHDHIGMSAVVRASRVGTDDTEHVNMLVRRQRSKSAPPRRLVLYRQLPSSASVTERAGPAADTALVWSACVHVRPQPGGRDRTVLHTRTRPNGDVIPLTVSVDDTRVDTQACYTMSVQPVQPRDRQALCTLVQNRTHVDFAFEVSQAVELLPADTSVWACTHTHLRVLAHPFDSSRASVHVRKPGVYVWRHSDSSSSIHAMKSMRDFSHGVRSFAIVVALRSGTWHVELCTSESFFRTLHSDGGMAAQLPRAVRLSFAADDVRLCVYGGDCSHIAHVQLFQLSLVHARAHDQVEVSAALAAATVTAGSGHNRVHLVRLMPHKVMLVPHTLIRPSSSAQVRRLRVQLDAEVAGIQDDCCGFQLITHMQASTKTVVATWSTINSVQSTAAAGFRSTHELQIMSAPLTVCIHGDSILQLLREYGAMRQLTTETEAGAALSDTASERAGGRVTQPPDPQILLRICTQALRVSISMSPSTVDASSAAGARHLLSRLPRCDDVHVCIPARSQSQPHVVTATWAGICTAITTPAHAFDVARLLTLNVHALSQMLLQLAAHSLHPAARVSMELAGGSMEALMWHVRNAAASHAGVGGMSSAAALARYHGADGHLLACIPVRIEAVSPSLATGGARGCSSTVPAYLLTTPAHVLLVCMTPGAHAHVIVRRAALSQVTAHNCQLLLRVAAPPEQQTSVTSYTGDGIIVCACASATAATLAADVISGGLEGNRRAGTTDVDISVRIRTTVVQSTRGMRWSSTPYVRTLAAPARTPFLVPAHHGHAT